MTEQEYQDLQKQFSKKIILWPTNKEEAYNNGIRSCKSILHCFYQNQNRVNSEKLEQIRCIVKQTTDNFDTEDPVEAIRRIMRVIECE